MEPQPAPKGAAHTSSIPELKPGDLVPQLGVRLDEVLLNDRKVLVFIDGHDNLQWLFTEQAPDSAWIYARVAELEARCEFFKHRGLLPCRLKGLIQKWAPPHSCDTSQRSAKRFIGQGVIIMLNGGTRAEAEAAFASAEAYILQRGREASLVWLHTPMAFLALLSLFLLLRIFLTTWETQTHLLWGTLVCACAGGVGAYISRALASRTELPCDANAGRMLHFQEAVLRWSVGVVAGGLICLLVKGKVMLGALEGTSAGFPAVLALATLSGMSERFLPTLLTRFNDQLAAPPPPSPAGLAADTLAKEKLKEAARAKRAEAVSRRAAADTAFATMENARTALSQAAEAGKEAARVRLDQALADYAKAWQEAKAAEDAAVKAEQEAAK